MSKQANLYRMVGEDHTCPFGLKSKYLLEKQGYQVNDHHLVNREQTDAFKKEHTVKTTPQAFIDGKRIGGYTDLREHFGLKNPDKTKTTYKPIIAIFATALLMAIAISYNAFGTFTPLRIAELFIAFSMCILAIQKLRDIDSFVNQFIGYDLIAMKHIPYAYIYPFAEAYVGLAMLAKFPPPILVSPIGFIIGLVGAVSVIKAVYIDKRDIKCACVGGNSNVPLGFISLSENLIMMVAAIWMFTEYHVG